jgi:hypothetical protein
MLRPSAPPDDPGRLMVRWRQSVYHRENDPRNGEQSLRLSLRTEAGQPKDLSDIRGKRWFSCSLS